jgi:predicted flap endonuclease-1-like 5' DNA nuclease
MADEAKKESPIRFRVTNVVRRVNSKVRRIVAPGRRHFKQFVCGKRLLRKQSIWISPEEMEKYKAQLYEQVREGAIEIMAPDGSILSVDVRGNLTTRKGMTVTIISTEALGLSKSAPAPKPIAKVVEEPKHVEVAVSLPAPPAPTTPVSVKVNDLTELPGVGAGRAKKLEVAGITTFKQIAEMSPGELVKILGPTVTEDQATDICNVASEKEG